MGREFKDTKILALVKKMDKYLKEREIPELKDKEFWNTIKISVDMFLTENGYPFYAVINDINRIMAIKMDNEATVFEIRIRYDISKKRPISERTYSFKSLVKTGPCFDMPVSEAVDRRIYGISYELEELSYDAEKLGYSSIDEMIAAYEYAEKIIDKLKYKKLSYDFIPENEREKFKKLKHEKKTDTWLVFIKSTYVRDAQAFIGNVQADIHPYSKDLDDDNAWLDVHGATLVAIYKDITKDEVVDRINHTYPEAADGVFQILTPEDFKSNTSIVL